MGSYVMSLIHISWLGRFFSLSLSESYHEPEHLPTSAMKYYETRGEQRRRKRGCKISKKGGNKGGGHEFRS